MNRRTFLAALATVAGCSAPSSTPSEDATATPTRTATATRTETTTATDTATVSGADTRWSVTLRELSAELDTGGRYGYVVTVSVTAEVENTGLNILLADDQDSTVAEQRIAEDKLLDGADAVTLELPSNPFGTTYTVQVVGGSLFEESKLIAKTTVDVPVVHGEIHNIGIETAEGWGETRVLHGVEATVKNAAEIPVPQPIVNAQLLGEKFELNAGSNATQIPPGESADFSVDNILNAPEIPEEDFTVTAKAGIDGRLFAESQTTVSVGE